MNKEEIKYMCCFCGETISAVPPDPIHIEIKMEGNAAQGLTAHRECLEKVLHSSVPLGIEEIEWKKL